jgi:F-type H+-transporting ATPase subunit b
MTLLRVEPGLLIWLWIAFGIILLVLRLTVWDRITGGLDKRAERIRSDLDGARSANEEAKKLLEQTAAKLEEAKQQAAVIVEQSRYQASVVREQLLTQTRTEVDEERKKAVREIEQAREEAVTKLHTEVVTLVMEAARAVLKREVTGQDEKALVDELIERFPSTN